jgi:pimeloyl-ACP methyl ester carboxylesterase
LEDILSFLENQVAEPGVLFGSSLGGWVALLAAAQAKGKVKGLILGDPPLDLDRFLAYEGSEERIATWQGMRELAGAGLSLPDLTSALAGSPFSGEMRAWIQTWRPIMPKGAWMNT